jgi:ApeA N-terminal domain 1
MRVDRDFVRTGFFWLPSFPEDKVPGVLRIEDGGSVELEIVGSFDSSFAELFENRKPVARIVGEVETEGAVTLDECVYRLKTMHVDGGIAKSILRVQRATFGVRCEAEQDLKLNEFRFTVDGLDDWLGVSGIKVSYPASEVPAATITFERPHPIAFDWGDTDLTFSFTFEASLPESSVTEACVSQRAFVRIESSELRPLAELRRRAHQFTNFLCFAINESLSMSDVYATSSEVLQMIDGEKVQRMQLRLFYESLPFTKDKPIVKPRIMLFRFEDVRINFVSILSEWFNAYEVINPALALYFSSRLGTHRFLSGRFLSLAQALETYHRRSNAETLMTSEEFDAVKHCLMNACPKGNATWLEGRLAHANEISLGQRLKRIIEPFKHHFGNSGARSSLVQKMVVTRNYLTHYDPSNQLEAASGRELWLLCMKMEAIFQLHLLVRLGFCVSEIDKILNGDSDLKQKIVEVV